MPELFRVVLAGLSGHPKLMAQIIAVVDTRRLPFDPTLVGHVLRWTFAAAMRGRPQVLADLLAATARAAGVYRELRARRRLLAMQRDEPRPETHAGTAA